MIETILLCKKILSLIIKGPYKQYLFGSELNL